MDLNSKIYVAGHRGLVGSSVVRLLESLGYNNIIKATSKELDLRNQSKVDEFFAQKKPEYVICSAAVVGGINANRTYPAEFIRDNLLIQTNVIHAAYVNNCKKFCFLGSSCIYPKNCPQPIKEEYLLESALEETNIYYASAKICGVKMIEAYRRQYNFPGYCLMPTNLIGINDNFSDTSHVFPALIKKFAEAIRDNNKVLHLYGTGKAKREFLNVDELSKVILKTLNMENLPNLINVGVGKDITIHDLALKISKVLDYPVDIVYDSDVPDGTMRKLLNIDLLNSLDIYTESNLDQDILNIYNWYCKNY